MFYGSNPYRKDNPRWVISDSAETARVPAAGARYAIGICVAWFIGLPRRAGTRLHASTDAEARWWHWNVAEYRGGLGRRYRDARFAAPRHDEAPRRVELGAN